MGSTVDWTCLRKESLSLGYMNRNLQNWKAKWKNDWKKYWNRLSKNCGKLKRSNRDITEIPKNRDKEREEIFETVMTENLPKVISDTKPRALEVLGTPSRMNVKKTTPRHNIFKLQNIKNKEKTEKASRKKTHYLCRSQHKNYIWCLRKHSYKM